MKGLRYRLEWKMIPESNEVKDDAVHQLEFKTYTEAKLKWLAIASLDDCEWALFKDRINGDRLEFTSGWLDHWPRAKKEKNI